MLVQSFIQPLEQKSIRDFILSLKGNPTKAVGEMVWFWRLSEVGKIIPEILYVRKRVIKFLGKCYKEPELEDMLVYVLPNGYIAEHKDNSPKGFKHIRANILIQMPESGGNLIHDNKEVMWQERDMYVLHANLPHKVNFVEGNKSLLVISYGFLIPL